VVVDTADGAVIGTRVFDYPSGDCGVLLDAKQPHLARQNPADYIEGLRVAVAGALADADGKGPFSRDRVIGVGVDTTGSTPLPAGVTDSRAIVRCICAAGHKAMYSEAWGGLPPKAFLERLDPKLAELRDRLYDKALPPGTAAGALSAHWAREFKLREGIAIAM